MAGHRRASWRARASGQGTVEFALIFPMVSVVIFGMISGSWLFLQASSLRDGASAGARTATIVTPDLSSWVAGQCEPVGPTSMVSAVTRGVNQLPVNQNQLCRNADPLTRTFVQVPQTDKVNITVVTTTIAGSTPAINTFKVTVTFDGKVIAPPFGSVIRFRAESEVWRPAP